MKGYSTYPRAQELGLHPQMQSSVIPRKPILAGFYSSTGDTVYSKLHQQGDQQSSLMYLNFYLTILKVNSKTSPTILIYICLLFIKKYQYSFFLTPVISKRYESISLNRWCYSYWFCLLMSNWNTSSKRKEKKVKSKIKNVNIFINVHFCFFCIK